MLQHRAVGKGLLWRKGHGGVNFQSAQLSNRRGQPGDRGQAQKERKSPQIAAGDVPIGY